MGGSLGPVFSNIKLTECDKAIVCLLIEDGIIKFYVRYVDDILLVIKRADVSYALNKSNSFDDNLNTFENCVPHILDIEICPNGLGIYHKPPLATRAKRICSDNYLNK